MVTGSFLAPLAWFPKDLPSSLMLKKLYRFAFLLLLASTSPCFAQEPSPSADLLRYVPPETGVCFVMNDLRGLADHWDKSLWLQSLKKSALGRALAGSPEFKN